MKILKSTLLLIIIAISFSSLGQNKAEFNGPKFPAEIIDQAIIQKRGLEHDIDMLKNDCDWEKRIGKKIDVFWLRTENGDFFGYVYEYFLDCDNLRLIYWYNNPSGNGKIVDFMVENLEDESIFVVSKKKHLKNKKKYKKYLEPEPEPEIKSYENTTD